MIPKCFPIQFISAFLGLVSSTVAVAAPPQTQVVHAGIPGTMTAQLHRGLDAIGSALLGAEQGRVTLETDSSARPIFTIVVGFARHSAMVPADQTLHLYNALQKADAWCAVARQHRVETERTMASFPSATSTTNRLDLTFMALDSGSRCLVRMDVLPTALKMRIQTIHIAPAGAGELAASLARLPSVAKDLADEQRRQQAGQSLFR